MVACRRGCLHAGFSGGPRSQEGARPLAAERAAPARCAPLPGATKRPPGCLAPLSRPALSALHLHPQGLCDPGALFSNGLPQGLQLAVWRAAGADTQGALFGALCAAICAPLAAYALRSWLLAQAAVSRGAASALLRLATGGRPAVARFAQAVTGSRGLFWGLGERPGRAGALWRRLRASCGCHLI